MLSKSVCVQTDRASVPWLAIQVENLKQANLTLCINIRHSLL